MIVVAIAGDPAVVPVYLSVAVAVAVAVVLVLVFLLVVVPIIYKIYHRKKESTNLRRYVFWQLGSKVHMSTHCKGLDYSSQVKFLSEQPCSQGS
jgi:mannose/fructose/N-acetylgalactosamine-specific phosphotransferase system component IIC